MWLGAALLIRASREWNEHSITRTFLQCANILRVRKRLMKFRLECWAGKKYWTRGKRLPFHFISFFVYEKAINLNFLPGGYRWFMRYTLPVFNHFVVYYHSLDILCIIAMVISLISIIFWIIYAILTNEWVRVRG